MNVYSVAEYLLNISRKCYYIWIDQKIQNLYPPPINKYPFVEFQIFKLPVGTWSDAGVGYQYI